MSQTVLPSAINAKYDSFFRSCSSEYFERSGGDIESPSGWYGALAVDIALRGLMAGTCDYLPADGLYLVMVDSSGLVWAYRGTADEVTGWCDALDTEYAAWIADDTDL